MSEPTRTPGHDWDFRFWSTLDRQKSEWAAITTAEDRLVFELEVEAMLRALVPERTDSLRRSYESCEWSDQLHLAVEASAGCQEWLDVDEVMAQLQTGVAQIVKDGIVLPPAVTLPFPEGHLAAFIQELKLFAFMTIWKFLRTYQNFLASLSAEVRRALYPDLFEATVEQLIGILRAPAAPPLK